LAALTRARRRLSCCSRQSARSSRASSTLSECEAFRAATSSPSTISDILRSRRFFKSWGISSFIIVSAGVDLKVFPSELAEDKLLDPLQIKQAVMPGRLQGFQ